MAYWTDEMTAWITKKTLDGVGDWFIVALVVLAALGGLRWALIDVRNYIDVEAIRVYDAQEGKRIRMDVARVLKGTFRGRWYVEIRNGRTGGAVCSTGMQPENTYWTYREFGSDGQRTTLPDPLFLDYWANGGSCRNVLGGPITAPTLPPGAYALETTHCVKAHWFLPLKCETWNASAFRVMANE